MDGTMLTLYAFNLAFCEALCADVPEEAVYEPAPPGAGLHPPAWILGHLAVCTDYAARLIGLETACPEAWHRAFGPGSSGGVDVHPRPGKDELLGALRAGHARVAAALGAGVSAERLAAPHGSAVLARTNLRTVGEALAHLMATHEAMHLGQLSVCRRVMGLPALL